MHRLSAYSAKVDTGFAIRIRAKLYFERSLPANRPETLSLTATTKPRTS